MKVVAGDMISVWGVHLHIAEQEGAPVTPLESLLATTHRSKHWYNGKTENPTVRMLTCALQVSSSDTFMGHASQYCLAQRGWGEHL